MASVKNRINKVKGHCGFTLLEIMIGLCVLMITLSIAIPSYIHWREKTAFELYVKKFVEVLEFARGYAVENDMSVTVCPSENGRACDANWGHDISIFAGGKMIQRLGIKSFEVSWRSSLGKNDKVVFTSLGMLNGQQGSFKISSHAGYGYKITLNYGGRIRSMVQVR